MLYCSHSNCMIVFKKFITAYVQCNFTHMSWATSSYFAKYVCDIYSEYITPYTVMIYATSDVVQVMPLRLHTQHSGAMD
jgi:hypothetical protein